jgi:hypothetical protein
MAKLGRPTIYNKEVGNKVCELISEGKTLREIGATEGLPSLAVISAWNVSANELYKPFQEQYARAMQTRAIRWAEELLEIADETSKDKMVDEYGNEKPNSEYINRSRLRVDTRKWLLSKVLPKVYGDRQQHEISGKDGIPLIPVMNFGKKPENE